MMLTSSLFFKLRSLSLIFLCSLFAFSASAQKADRDFEQIKSLLFTQQTAWNEGNIDQFMEAYWKSDDLQFGGASGITRGWQATLDGYKKRYPNKAAMGQLTFEVKDLSKHSKKVISLTGSWYLKRSIGDIGGHFLLIWRKINGQWKIVVDHTSTQAS